MKILSKILMMALVSCALCSCDKDTDENGDTTSTPKEVKISYSYSNTKDFFDLMNVSVEYIDSEGTLQNKSIDENWSYEATVPYASAPKEYKFVVTCSAAVQGLEKPKDKYTFQQSLNAVVTKVFPNGDTKNVGQMKVVDRQPKTYLGSKINEYLARYKNPSSSIPFEESLDESSEE